MSISVPEIKTCSICEYSMLKMLLLIIFFPEQEIRGKQKKVKSKAVLF